VWKAYEHLDDLFSEEDNWKKYRAALDAAAAEPAVPYLNRILQDLTSVSEKNPDMLPDTELINFSKMYMLEEIAKTHSFQNSPPNFRSSFIAKYIEQFTPLSLNALQELTVRLEAKSKYDTLD
jgi:son of sevenless-like protein